MAKYQILYWYDIPLQVRASDKGLRFSKILTQRFQLAIDNAAMAAGVTEGDAYTSLLKWSEPQERTGTAQDVAELVATELEKEYSEIDWQKTANALKNVQ